MLGNGMMGPGIIEGPVVFFGLFVWAAVAAISLFWFFYATRLLLQGLGRKYGDLTEPPAYGREAALKMGPAAAKGAPGKSERKKLAA